MKAHYICLYSRLLLSLLPISSSHPLPLFIFPLPLPRFSLSLLPSSLTYSLLCFKQRNDLRSIFVHKVVANGCEGVGKQCALVKEREREEGGVRGRGERGEREERGERGRGRGAEGRGGERESASNFLFYCNENTKKPQSTNKNYKIIMQK
jgi:hypothetical protein